MNKLKKYLILLSIALPLFGQVYTGDYSQNNYSFKEAVKEYNAGNYDATDKIIEKISSSEKEYFKEEIALLSMRVKYRLNDYSSGKEIGKFLLLNYPNSKYSADVLITLGDIFIAEGLYNAAFRTYIKSYKNNYNKQYEKIIIKRVFMSLQMGISPSIPEELLSIEIDPGLTQILLLAKVHNELQANQPIKAANSLSQINTKDLLKINHEYYSKLKNKLSDKTKDRAIIGVVLPLTGKDAKIGMEFLNGLKYAKEINFSDEVELSLIVYDNAGDALTTLEVFQSLIKNPNVVAIVGPISADNSVVASSIAEINGVPLILPTTSMNGLSEVSNNIFLMNSDLTTRGNITGEFVTETLEAKNIAVLAPADKFGKSLVDAFISKLKSVDIIPQIIEWYSGIPVNLERQFKLIRAKAWALSDTTDSYYITNSTIDSLLVEDKLDDDLIDKEEMTADDSSKVILNSIDAIYMPIHAGHLDYVGAQYPAYNLNAVVIGNDNWADLEILRKEIIGPHYEEMYVISNYKDYQMELLNNNFDVKHTGYFYQAIDCHNLLVKSIKEANDSNTSLMQILSNVDDFDGIFGTYNFTKSDNKVNSALNIVKFNGYSFNKYVDQDQYIQY